MPSFPPRALGGSEQESVTGHVEFVNAVGNTIVYSISANRHEDGRVSGEVQEHAQTPDGEVLRRTHATVICIRAVAGRRGAREVPGARHLARS